MTSQHTERILIADCGASETRVSLVAQVDGVFQLVDQAESLSTHQGPEANITTGVIEALRQLEAQSDLTFLHRTGFLIQPQNAEGSGVNAFIFVTSAAPPVSVSLVGLMSQLSLSTARRAVTSTYGVVDYQLGLDDEVEARGLETRVQSLAQTQSDLILLVGGLDDGASSPIIDLAHIIALTLKLVEPERRPRVVYAGNSQLRLQVADILGSLTDFISVENIRPEPEVENLTAVQAELDHLYLERKLPLLPEVDKLLDWSNNRAVSAASSFEQSVRYVGHTYGVQTLGVDVGRDATTISLKRNYNRDRSYLTTTRTDIDLGQNIAALLTATAWGSFERWLPFECSEGEFKNFALNKTVTPQTAALTERELWLELALMREAMQLVQMQAQERLLQQEEEPVDWLSWDLIVGSGSLLARLSDPALAALTLLDGLEPAGLCRLILDTRGLFRILGGLATIKPQAAIQLVDQGFQFAESDAFLNLGMVVAPVGISGFGSTALRLQVTYNDGRKIDKKIPFGAIEVLPLAANEEAELHIRPARHLSVNPQWGQAGRAVSATVSGGLLGLIIDARGRPLVFARKDQDRYEQLQDWLTHLRSMGEIEQPEVVIPGGEVYAI